MNDKDKLISNSLFDEQMKDKKIKPDNSQFIVDLSKNRITCNKCGCWFSLSHPQLTPEQIKGNFKVKHKSCK